MPNYTYKCDACGFAKIVTMPMGRSPNETFPCSNWTPNQKERHECLGYMKRIFAPATLPGMKMERDTLGKWYKENTGKELLGGQ